METIEIKDMRWHPGRDKSVGEAKLEVREVKKVNVKEKIKRIK